MKKIISKVLILSMLLSIQVMMPIKAEESWRWPCESREITQRFKTGHNGIDIGGTHGKTAIYAAKDGKVVASYSKCTCRSDNGKKGVLPGGTKCRHGKSMGNYVVLDHGKGVYTRYMHMYWVGIPTVGAFVKQGDVIGYMGSTGNSTGVHLHFEIRTGGTGVSGGAVLNGKAKNVNTSNINYIYSNSTTSNTQTPASTPTPTTSTLKINITSYPTTINQGSSFGLRGNVSSNYKLTSVNGYILSSDGKTIIQGAYDKQNIYNVDIRTSVVNQKLLFNKLSPGSYIYKVTAWDESGANRVWSKPFTVKGKESTLKINITSAPTTIKKGSMFGLRGNVTSNYKLTSVNGYILSSDGKTIIQGAYDKQNIYNVDIRTSVVNQKLLFDKLSRGSYIFKVTAWDESGANKIWSKPFTVK